MNLLVRLRFYAIPAFIVFALAAGWRCVVSANDDQVTNEKGVEVLVRGPVHEAFAETMFFSPEAGVTVAKSPPDIIKEVVPNQRPEGDHVSWIPGYWAWDDDRSDYLWVSGIWRSVPPGRQWIPGTWIKADDGYQWASGYWADIESTSNEYLTEPPESLEDGPKGTAPSDNDIWLPGSWIWKESRYEWRPGYWATAQANWLWTPAQYIWSPNGYVFVDGYYDYTLARRGMLFAPVYFSSAVATQQGFTYSPAMVINPAVFENQLFLRSGYSHYYFGDYFGANNATAGYMPWFSLNSSRQGYDPFYAHQVWQNRNDPTWEKTVKNDFQNRVDHQSARPPRTLAEQQAQLKSNGTSGGKQLVVATPLAEMAGGKSDLFKLQSVTKDEHQKFTEHGQGVNQFREERQKQVAKKAENAVEEPDRSKTPVKEKAAAKTIEPAKASNLTKDAAAPASKTAKSPIIAQSSEQLGKEHTPPKPHVVPASDPTIEPKQRHAVAKPALPPERSNAKPGEPNNKQTTQTPKSEPQKANPKEKTKK